MAMHPDAVAQNGAAAERACRIDRQNPDRPFQTPVFRRQLVNQRALANAGRTGNPDHAGFANPAGQPRHQHGRHIRIVLDEGNGARDRALVAGQNAVCQVHEPPRLYHRGPQRRTACWTTERRVR